MVTERDFGVKPVLEGQTVVLRPFADEDWESMAGILDDREAKILTGSVGSGQEADQPMDSQEREQIRSWYQSRNQQTDRLDLAVVDKSSGMLIGEVVFNEYQACAGIVNFRILLGAAGRNKGMGTEATALFVRYGFQALSLHKIELEVYSFNQRAEYVYQKSGFVLEGTKRENFKFNNQYFDTKLYGLLRSEYMVGFGKGAV
ncbi:MAG: GNAT family protein [Candidatus Limiplasma sp.]|nr:GNAT family protein [Candidatus Limiplasma sp.]